VPNQQLPAEIRRLVTRYPEEAVIGHLELDLPTGAF
jgi:hypothetical protein